MLIIADSIASLTLEDNDAGVSTDPPLPHTPELQQRLEDAKADQHQLKALIRYVRHEFSCKYKSEGKLSQSATIIA